MKIKLSYYDKAHILRQTPNGDGNWEDCNFLLNQSVKECDAWVVFDELPRTEKTICDPNRTIFITAEPSSVRRYDERFLSQFAAVITPQIDIAHPHVIYQHPASHWFVGVDINDNGLWSPRLNYDAFKAMSEIPKSKKLSVICSNKSLTPGHRVRLTFLSQLINHFGSEIDVFGNGFRRVSDKWEALAPYRYSIVLENSCFPHYWTEKVSDAFLAATFPFYCGCPNLANYFPSESFSYIDPTHPQDAISTIAQALENNTYESAIPYVRKSRDLILNRYNMFPMISELLHKLPVGTRRKVTMRPEWYFSVSPTRRLRHDIKSSLKHLISRAAIQTSSKSGYLTNPKTNR